MMKTECGSVPGLAIMEGWKVNEDQDWFYDLPDVESLCFLMYFFSFSSDGDKEILPK